MATDQSSLLPGGNLRIGSFQVQAGLLRIVGPTKTVEIRPKEMQILCYLAQNTGRACSTGEILNAVWKDQAVGSHIVASTIYELRKALREVADDPDFDVIENIRRQGYHLTLAVEWTDAGSPAAGSPAAEAVPATADEAVDVPADPVPHSDTAARPPKFDWSSARLPALRVDSSRRLRRSSTLAAVTLAAILGAGFLSEWMRRSKDSPRPTTVAFVPADRSHREADSLSYRLERELRGLKQIEIVAEDRPHELVVEIDVDQTATIRIRSREGNPGDYVEIVSEPSQVAARLRQRLANIHKTRAPSTAAWIHYQVARDLYDARRFEEAISALRKAIDASPSYAYAHELLAGVYNVTGDTEQARAEIERALELADDLDEVARNVFLWRKAQVEGDVEAEFGHLKKLHSFDPQEPEWNLYLGFFYRTHRRDCDKSLQRFADAIAYSNPPKPRYVAYLSDTLLICGRADEAVEKAREYAEMRPGGSTTEFLAMVYVLTGRLEEARELIDRALVSFPEFDSLHFVDGLLHFSRGRFREAEKAFERFRVRVELDADEMKAYSQLARVHLARRDYDLAIEAADRAIERHELAVEAFWIRGWAQLLTGHLEQSRDTAAKIQALWDRDRSGNGLEYYHHLMGKIALAEGDTAGAVRCFRQALDLGPTDHAFFGDALAGALASQGKLAEAEAAYLKVFEFNPNYAASRCGMAKVYEAQGFRDDAAEQYDHCLRVLGRDNDEEPLAAEARTALAVLR